MRNLHFCHVTPMFSLLNGANLHLRPLSPEKWRFLTPIRKTAENRCTVGVAGRCEASRGGSATPTLIPASKIGRANPPIFSVFHTLHTSPFWGGYLSVGIFTRESRLRATRGETGLLSAGFPPLIKYHSDNRSCPLSLCFSAVNRLLIPRRLAWAQERPQQKTKKVFAFAAWGAPPYRYRISYR